MFGFGRKPLPGAAVPSNTIAIDLSNGGRVSAYTEEWVAAIIRSLPPEQLERVCLMIEAAPSVAAIGVSGGKVHREIRLDPGHVGMGGGRVDLKR